ncbi:MAG: hypothetical protein ABI894_10935 [Ilumatobacteraceae bacterium]
MNIAASIASTPSAAKAVTEPDQKHLLQIYLRDHEAAAAGGLELFRRCSRSNEGTPYAEELQRLTSEIRLKRDALRDICRQFDVAFSKVGQALAFAGVTLGRLKTNGRALTYSPLSRVIELEAMSAGVMTQLRLWQLLLHIAAVDQRLDKEALNRHVTDANEQLEALVRLHQRAVHDAFL